MRESSVVKGTFSREITVRKVSWLGILGGKIPELAYLSPAVVDGTPPLLIAPAGSFTSADQSAPYEDCSGMWDHASRPAPGIAWCWPTSGIPASWSYIGACSRGKAKAHVALGNTQLRVYH